MLILFSRDTFMQPSLAYSICQQWELLKKLDFHVGWLYSRRIRFYRQRVCVFQSPWTGREPHSLHTVKICNNLSQWKSAHQHFGYNPLFYSAIIVCGNWRGHRQQRSCSWHYQSIEARNGRRSYEHPFHWGIWYSHSSCILVFIIFSGFFLNRGILHAAGHFLLGKYPAA